ncbi:MAG: DUF3124 domain-containing protein [Desulfobulbus sp.]|nr:DUF3124 domain-containing protein [Desulfobulbus sp.]
MKIYRLLSPLLLLLLLLARPLSAAEVLSKWLNQTVYVPIYSHIYADDRYRDTPFLLTATLSIRNTDSENTFTLTSVRYYDSEGKLLQHYLEKPLPVAPLTSIRFIVPESESKGGSGAKFLVEWEAKTAVTEPIIESIMIGTKMQQGISFISTGRVIKGTPGR